MRSSRSLCPAGALLVVAGLLGVSAPAAVAQAPTSCTTPELAAIDGELLKARVAIAAGDEEMLRTTLTQARDALDALVEACWGAAASPAPSTIPVDLGATATLDGFSFGYPADLQVLETELLRPVERDGVAAGTITLGDSPASGELLSSRLTAAVPDSFRVISLAVGDPIATLASVGAFETSDSVPTSPLEAARSLGERIEQVSRDSDLPIKVQSVRAVAFPSGEEGASLVIDFTDGDGGILARGGFAIRPLPGGVWLLGVAVSSDAGFTRIGDDLGAVLASVTGDGEG